ncbi:hypothetical protein ACDX78_06370 [Virgibacillus oceani]
MYRRKNYKNMVRRNYESREDRSIRTLLIRNKPIEFKLETELVFLQVIGFIIF